MGWATSFIERLRLGETVTFRPHGNSMVPRIRSGDLVTVAPITESACVGDIVLCKVQGREYLHKVTGIRGSARQLSHFAYQISNNKGHVNGWTPAHHVYGILTKVEA